MEIAQVPSYINLTSTPFSCFPGENLQNTVPHIPFLHNKVFHKNIFPGFFQFRDHCTELILTQRKISNFRITIYRKSQVMRQIICKVGIRRLAGSKGIYTSMSCSIYESVSIRSVARRFPIHRTPPWVFTYI